MSQEELKVPDNYNYGEEDDSIGNDWGDDSKRIDQRENRDFRCNFCSKTYLSYPALYTHLKNKHAKGPDGNPLGQTRGGPVL